MLFVLVYFVLGIYHKYYLVYDHSPNGHFTIILDNGKDPLNSSRPLYLDSSKLSYCQPPNICEMTDEMELIHSPSNREALSTTRVIEVVQRRKCAESEKVCNSHEMWWHELADVRKKFTVEPETFVLQIEHSLGKSHVHDDAFLFSNLEMRGSLLNREGVALKRWDIGVARDEIPLSLLLAAAGIGTLEAESDQGVVKNQHLKEKDLTFRETGVLLELEIFYTNTNNFFGTDVVEYFYKVQRIPSRSVRKSFTQEINAG